MSATDLLRSLFRYQAWADEEFLVAVAQLDLERRAEDRRAVLRLLNHCHVVGRIFAAHLTGRRHGYAADNTPETPEPEALRAALAESDRWYLDYLDRVTPAELSEAVAFTFTDGDRGCMTRQEMLAHVVTHGGYHRGEAGRILTRLAAGPAPGLRLPWDTYAVHLHSTEPARRRRASAPASAKS
ncbi:DinB family protein [Inquilinus sp.]|uniref:DinB family protein n=1 Tax=Inquilinus sp. TaxID=1932117 RepID=UPI0031D46D6A